MFMNMCVLGMCTEMSSWICVLGMHASVIDFMDVCSWYLYRCSFVHGCIFLLCV